MANSLKLLYVLLFAVTVWQFIERGLTYERFSTTRPMEYFIQVEPTTTPEFSVRSRSDR